LNLNSRFKQLELNSPGRPILRSFSAIPGLWFRSLSIKFRNPGEEGGQSGGWLYGRTTWVRIRLRLMSCINSKYRRKAAPLPRPFI